MVAFRILFGKKFNGLIAEPMTPFLIAGAVVYYGVWRLEEAMIDTDEWRNDARNRRRPAQSPKPSEKAEPGK